MKIKKRRSIIRRTLRYKKMDQDHKTTVSKFVPFLMENFAEYVNENGFEAEYFYLQRVLQSKPTDKKNYNIIDLISIFSCSQLKNLQLLWKLFLRIEASKVIIKKIYSKRVQIIYSRKVEDFVQRFEQKRGYQYYILYQLMVEHLSHTDKRYNRLKENNDLRIRQGNYPIDPIKFKFNVYKILQKLKKYEIDNPKKRLNNFLAIIDIVKHFNQIQNFHINQRNMTDKLIWNKSSYEMTNKEILDKI